MVGGQYVTRLAKHFGILGRGAVASMISLGEMGLIDMEQLKGMGVVKSVRTTHGTRYHWETRPERQELRGRPTVEHSASSSGAAAMEESADWNAYARYQGMTQQLSNLQLSFDRHHQRMEYNSTKTLHQTNLQSGVLNQVAEHLGVQPTTAYAPSPLWPFSDESPPVYGGYFENSEEFNPRETWDILGEGAYSSNVKVKGLNSPLNRLLHCMLVHAVNSRSSSEEKISVYDLWLLYELRRRIATPCILYHRRATSKRRVVIGVVAKWWVANMCRGFDDKPRRDGSHRHGATQGHGVVKSVRTTHGTRYHWETRPERQELRGRPTVEHGASSNGAAAMEESADWNAYAGYQGMTQQLSNLQLSFDRHHQRMEYNSTETLHQTNWQSGVLNQVAEHLGVQPTTAYAPSPLWPFSDESPPGFPILCLIVCNTPLKRNRKVKFYTAKSNAVPGFGAFSVETDFSKDQDQETNESVLQSTDPVH
ncbi:hypothetical protein OSB04_031766 [Centaurea solstitialis]|uniref:Uncharacterized protein n=1 Tax=Centaurea solstitialis TaxID=347529 RepID=A0AA38SVA5_9ASTR|nr:hypothetical protein OSB04_031766 [Centaurea solstitialis]